MSSPRRAAVTAVLLLAIVVPAVADEERTHKQRAEIALGRMLFHEPAASLRGVNACADCHRPSHGFSDPRRLSFDGRSRSKRHSQPLFDIQEIQLHWDGAFGSLEVLTMALVATPTEREKPKSGTRLDVRYLGPEDEPVRESERSRSGSYYGAPVADARGIRAAGNEDGAGEWLARKGGYDQMFQRAFGGWDPTSWDAARAISSYVRSLRSGDSPYDAFVAGDTEALSGRARAGLQLFQGKAGCVRCHELTGERAVSDGRLHDTGLGDGAMKTPNLRNVALRPPYMHDGSLESLEDVVQFYDTASQRSVRSSVEIRPLELSADERAALVAFLHSLTADAPPRSGYDAQPPAETAEIVVVGMGGLGIPDLDVRVTPRGGALNDGAVLPAATTVTTGEWGVATYELPASTHVEFESDDYELGDLGPLPNTGAKRRLVAFPRSMVVVCVTFEDDEEEAPESLVLNRERLDFFDRAEPPIRLERVGVRHDGVLYGTDRLPGWERRAVRLDSLRHDDGIGTLLPDFDLSGGAALPLFVPRRAEPVRLVLPPVGTGDPE